MSNSRPAVISLLVVLVLATIAGLYYYRLSAHSTFKMAMAGSRSVSDEIVVSGGNLFIEDPHPGVFFGSTQMPGQAPQFSYLIFFKYAAPSGGRHGHGVTFNGGINGRVAHTSESIDIEGQKLSADVRLDLDEARKTVERETLRIGGRQVDPQAGRVFLLDLTVPQPQWTQLNAPLPTAPSELRSAADVEMFVGALREKLRGADPSLDAYLK